MVRKATIQDADSIFELVKDFATSFKPQKDLFLQSFKNMLSDKKVFIFVAYSGDKIVGYSLGFIHATFFANGNVAWLEEIMVAPQFRRAGIGAELVKAFEQKAIDNDCKLIALATRRAADFYLAIGYEESAAYLRKLL
ncbi:MAG: GNAT family N-acetyltransferase [Lachnospiraceae bacterium]|nr:GNAT family N-acetyltransferase [Lachnospiraceae bacterium]